MIVQQARNAPARGTSKVSTPSSVFLHYEAYSRAGQIIQTKTFLFHYCPTQPKYRQLKTAQIYNVNFKAIWWIFFKSSSDNMLNLINDFRFISVLQWYLKVLRPFEVLLLCQKLLISLKELVNAYLHDWFCNPSFLRHAGGALVVVVVVVVHWATGYQMLLYSAPSWNKPCINFMVQMVPFLIKKLHLLA